MNHFFTYLLLFISSLYAAGEHQHENPARYSEPSIVISHAQEEILGISCVSVSKQVFSESAFAIGEICSKPSQHAVLSSRIAGRVIGIHAQVGYHVKAGQRLLSVESRLPGNPAPTIELTAPMDGVVSESHVRRGEPVEPDKEMMDIVDLDQVLAVARVPERYFTDIKIGSKAWLKIPALGGESQLVRVSQIATQAEKISGTISVSFEIDNPADRLREGMRAEFNLILKESDSVLSLPKSALLGETIEPFVLVKDAKDEHRFSKKLIRIGRHNHDSVEVLEGLTENDLVVTKGAYALSFIDSKSNLSLKDALDAAHGHEHNSDGSEKSESDASHQHEEDFSKWKWIAWISIALNVITLAMTFFAFKKTSSTSNR